MLRPCKSQAVRGEAYLHKTRLICVTSILVLLAVMIFATQAITTREAAGATTAGAAAKLTTTAVQTTAATPTVSPAPTPESIEDVEKRWILIAATAMGAGAVAVGTWGVAAVVSKNKNRKP